MRTTVSLTTAVSTAPGGSTAVPLNWIGGKPTSVSLTWNSSSALGVTQIQYTLDDIMQVPSTAVTWLPVVSSAGSSTVATYVATTFFDTGVTLGFLNPIGAVRMFSTGITAGASQIITMRVMQGEGG